MKKNLLFIVSFLILHPAFSQAPAIQWQKSLGGTGDDRATSITQTVDGGTVTAGYSLSNNGDVTGNHGGTDYWVVKLDSTSTIQWQKCLGGTGDDRARSIVQTTDGGYVVAGNSTSYNGDVTGNHGGIDYWVAKLDTTGAIQWQKCLGGTQQDVPYAIQQTTDGGYIVARNSFSSDGDVTGNHGGVDYWVVKLDSTGTLQWQKSLGGTGADWGQSIVQTADGGYVAAGPSDSNNGDVTGNHGGQDYWVVKLDAAGNIQWQKSLGGTSLDAAYSIAQTTDGGYVAAGTSSSNNGDVTGNHGGSDYWVVKLDGVGVIQWQKSLGGTTGDGAYSIAHTTDGGYVVAGYSLSNNGDVTGNHGGADYWVLKLDSAGTLQWQKSLGGTGADLGQSIVQTADGGYVTAGYSLSNDGDVTGNHGNNDYWVVKLAPDFPTAFNALEQSVFSISLSPNPATNEITIHSGTFNVQRIEIINVLGERVYDQQLSTLNFELQTVDVSQLPSGIYFVKVKGEAGERVAKFVKE